MWKGYIFTLVSYVNSKVSWAIFFEQKMSITYESVNFKLSYHFRSRKRTGTLSRWPRCRTSRWRRSVQAQPWPWLGIGTAGRARGRVAGTGRKPPRMRRRGPWGLAVIENLFDNFIIINPYSKHPFNLLVVAHMNMYIVYLSTYVPVEGHNGTRGLFPNTGP